MWRAIIQTQIELGMDQRDILFDYVFIITIILFKVAFEKIIL